MPGESYLEVLDALHDTPEIRFVICRQEGGAAMMATAWGELTGRPGVAMVTRGPGATNASAGVHIAQQDSVPMVLFVGQIDRGSRERDTFQEVDYRQMFGGMAKWVAEIDDAGPHPGVRPPRLRHGHGRPARARSCWRCPRTCWSRRPTVADGAPGRGGRARPRARAPWPSCAGCSPRAERPFVILGGGGWSEAGVAALARFLDANDLPAACGFRRQDLLDNEHRCYAGHIGLGPNPKLAARIKAADLVLAIGARLGETTSQSFTLLDVPRPRQTFVHVHNDPEELGRVYQADLADPVRPERLRRRRRPRCRRCSTGPGPQATADGACRGAGLARAHPHRRQPAAGRDRGLRCASGCRRTPSSPTAPATTPSGPTATSPIAASAPSWRRPRARWATACRPRSPPSSPTPTGPVVCFAGDGCFLMTGQELATAVQYELPIVVIVVDNGMYGTIRMHQEREHPGRVSGTALRNPDFAALARAYGAFGARVETTEEFAPGLRGGAGLAAGRRSST